GISISLPVTTFSPTSGVAAARPSWRRANHYLHHLPTSPSTST
uniref:Uncharacterized protein n=1 Tax=Aegilops tauschii subsp. strangulata TaxID=200361 RepID=A0A453ETK5_AEGTS